MADEEKEITASTSSYKETGQKRHRKSVIHNNFLRPILANMLPRYGLASQRDIRSRTTAIKPFYTQSRPLNSSGLFQDFEYSPTTYNMLEIQQRQEKKESDYKFQALCRGRFATADMKVRLKYEDSFAGGVSSVYSHYDVAENTRNNEGGLGASSSLLPIQSSITTAAAAAAATNNKTLAAIQQRPSELQRACFIPAGARLIADVDEYNRQALSRKSLPDIIRRLYYEVLRKDWAEADFSVAATMDDFIIIQWKAMTVDNVKALISYMNVMIDTHPLCRKFLLSRVTDRWGTEQKQAGEIWFVIRPSWIKCRIKCRI